jgi:hypothetical protein
MSGEHSPGGQEGIAAWWRGTRLGQLLHRLNSGRYEQYVPQRYREMAEERGIPLPERIIPSAEGRPVRIPDELRIAGHRESEPPDIVSDLSDEEIEKFGV